MCACARDIYIYIERESARDRERLFGTIFHNRAFRVFDTPASEMYGESGVDSVRVGQS